VTPQVEQLIERGFSYLDAGYPVNLSGPAGSGKTTLALHLAAKLGRPVTLIHGDDEFGARTSWATIMDTARTALSTITYTRSSRKRKRCGRW